MTTSDSKGWWAYPINAKKAHFFVEQRSLCGRWLFFGEQPDQPQGMSDAPGRDDCVQCWRRAKEMVSA